MHGRFSLTTLGFFGLLACSASVHDDPHDARSGHALEYVAPCTPAECDDQAVPMIGCADGGTPTFSCAPVEGGACHVTPTCDDGVVSYAPCDPSECGPLPQIGCPPGYTLTQACGSENGNACTWTIGCVPPPSTTPCPTPDGCGPMPQLAPICDDGSAGTLACMQTDSTCTWQPQCP